MSEKFVKIDKEFTLSDSSLNVYGFRLLTSGYQLAEFVRNPIGYYMHEREGGVLVRWTDLAVRGDIVVGKPMINMHHDRGQKTVDEINNGFLNAASFGKLVALELSTDDSLLLPNQEGPTVTKWFNRECSLVDIPGNFNAVMKLYDKEDNEINLADFSKQNLNMKQILLTAEQIGKLNLKADTADAAAVEIAFNDLVANAAKVPGLNQQLTAANAELLTLKKEVNKNVIASLIADGLDAGKVTKLASDKLAADYAENPEGLKSLMEALPAYKGVVATIGDGTGKDAAELKDLAAKDYGTLDKEGKLERLKALSPDTFKEKFKIKFGTDYNG